MWRDIAAFTDPTGGLPAAEWDALAGDLLYATSAWLRYCEAETGGVARAGAVFAGREAAVPITAVEREDNRFYQWHTQLTDRGLPSPGPAGVLVGARRGYRTHLLAAPGTPRERAAGLLLDQLGKLRAEVAKAGLLPSAGPGEPPCVAMFLGTDDASALRAAGVSATPVLLSLDAEIPVPPGDWQDWLRALPSKGRRDTVKHEVKAFQAAGYRITRAPLTECYREAARLLAFTQRRHGHPHDLARLTESFHRQAQEMGPAADVLWCRRGDEPPTGYCLYYISGDTLYVRSVGLDYDRLAGAAEYFNLVYYETTRISAARGLRLVHVGPGVPETKALRGARLRPLWLLDIAPQGPFTNAAVEVRAHNVAALREFASTSPAVAKALDADAELYAPFC
jgi:hypothetical protein